MEESILNSIKKLLGIDPSYKPFDVDIIIHINTVFGILYQIGYGEVYTIQDERNIWCDYLKDSNELEMIKSYVYMKVRMLFDPLQGAAAEAMNKLLSELEWRIYITVNSEV